MYICCLWGHSSITSSKRWVGGVRKWQFVMIYSTVNHQRSGWLGLKKSKTWWRNTWMVPQLVWLSFPAALACLTKLWYSTKLQLETLRAEQKSSVSSNVSLVVKFQRWWVLNSKIFGQKSIYSNETSLSKIGHDFRR